MPEAIEAAVRRTFPDSILESSIVDNVLTLKIAPASLVPICEYLKSSSDLAFDYPADLTAADWPDRIELVYHLYSMSLKHKITLKADLERESPVAPSVVSVWKGAEWQEREIFDLFGVRFEGNPDLRRILLPEEFEGYPLRKDYVMPE